jgi:shikimate 5-dehydrogenase
MTTMGEFFALLGAGGAGAVSAWVLWQVGQRVRIWVAERPREPLELRIARCLRRELEELQERQVDRIVEEVNALLARRAREWSGSHPKIDLGPPR